MGKLGRFDEAIDEFNRTMEFDPKIGLAYFHVGWAYMQKGDLDKAESMFWKSKELGISPPLVSYHLKKMIDIGIIEEATVCEGKIYPFPKRKKPHWSNFFIDRKRAGREVVYKPKDLRIAQITYRILITHKHSLPDEDIIDSLFDLCNDGSGKMPKKLKSVDSQYDFIINTLKDILKPPFVA